MRLAIVAAVCLSMVGLAVAAEAQAAVTKMSTNIPAQGLGPALKTLAKDRGFQVVFRTEVVGSARTRGAFGEMTTPEALSKLLEGTNLGYSYLDENTVTILPRSELETGSAGGGGDAPARGSRSEGGDKKEGQKSNSFRLAQVDQGAPSGAASVGAAANSKEGSMVSAGLSEIVVTAQKKSERLQDVPVPVTVLNADRLSDNGQVLLKDYYASVPGLSLSPNIESDQMLTIRGITTGGFTNPTVGVTVDDVPYGAATQNEYGNGVPNFDPGDLDRIEVLRGPQGTLYGANSMGGLIKYVTRDPSTAGFSGRIEAGTSDVYNGNEPGYSLRASANIPISDTLAIRVSAFTRQDAGYVDNVRTGQEGVNKANSEGARLAALWRPSEDFSLKLSTLFQNTKGDGPPDVNAGLGYLQQNYIRGVGEYDKQILANSLTLNYKIAGAELTSITGYNVNREHDSLDYSIGFGQAAFAIFGVTGGPLYSHFLTNKFSQEIRLSIPFGQQFEWLVGGFYTHEHAPHYQYANAANPDTGQSLGLLASLGYGPIRFEETAAFTNLTYHVTDRFDLQIGGRESHITESDGQTTDSGPLFGSAPFISPAGKSSANAFTYLLTPQFKINPDLMVYARLASGYRPGGPNSPFPGVPTQYSPDKTQDYEVGVKGDFLDHTLSLDTSLYYITWKNLQLDLQTPPPQNLQYLANGSKAKSEGVEVSVTSRPITGLTLAGWVAYDDAVLTEPFPPGPAYGASGDRLPSSSKWSANASVQQDFPLVNSTIGFVGAEVSYVGDRKGTFTDTALRQDYPAYTKTDLRAGVKYDFWTVNLYANNVANRRGLLNGGIGYVISNAYIYIPPRTLGVSVSRTF